MERLEEAARELETAIDLAPRDYPDLRVRLAGVSFKQGQLDKAINLCRTAYPFNSDSISFVENFELLLLRQGQLDEAQKMTSRVFELEESPSRWPASCPSSLARSSIQRKHGSRRRAQRAA